ncbi:3-oxoacyl-ACP reductase FabG [Gammaproteobacteria bacterium]|jgi:3-oxoacyl-[acyl-carrier protein] reductase|nr:3-oxoacyl-ACP reductase FabG [Gammaproteobacteria bacterium]|tara:strand:- start:635 stop:1378 length:744 start_codon:yes stop_codon:yes gene_type:complete
MNKYKDKVVLVTGASRGIGKAIANKFARQGAFVIGTATTQASADIISKNITADNFTGIGLVLNIADKLSVDEFGNKLKELDAPNILVNNAGITRDNLLMRMKDHEWEEVVNTNLSGMFRVTKLCMRSMMKQRYGRIINISSVVGLSGNSGQSNYSASKAGMLGFTRSLAVEVGSRGITVNAVAPGFISTEMTDELNDEIRDSILNQIPLARLGHPEEIANVVDFLSTDESAYITGQTISVNGGMYMG